MKVTEKIIELPVRSAKVTVKDSVDNLLRGYNNFIRETDMVV